MSGKGSFPVCVHGDSAVVSAADLHKGAPSFLTKHPLWRRVGTVHLKGIKTQELLPINKCYKQFNVKLLETQTHALHKHTIKHTDSVPLSLVNLAQGQGKTALRCFSARMSATESFFSSLQLL